MKLCLYIPSGTDAFLGSGTYIGGAERQYVALAHALSDDHEVHVVVDAPTDGRSKSDAPFALHFLPGAEQGQKGLRALRHRIRSVLEGFDWDVLVQRTARDHTLPLALECRRLKRPFVYHWALDQDHRGQALKGHPLRRQAFVLGKRMATAQIVQTRRQQVLAGNAWVVPNAMVAPVHATEPGPVALWLAQITPHQKRPDRLFAIARALPDVSFKMAGGLRGDAEFQQWFQQELENTPNVDHVGAVAADQVQELYSEARCLINTSDEEGFANAFLEACAARVPIVSWVHDPDGIITDQGAGICARGDMSAMVDAVRSMFNDTTYSQFREACAQVASRYNLEATTSAFMECLRSVTNQ